jgi:hypothetical protein
MVELLKLLDLRNYNSLAKLDALIMKKQQWQQYKVASTKKGTSLLFVMRVLLGVLV